MTFEFSLGGYGQTNFWLRLQDGQLHCSEGMPWPSLEEEQTIPVTRNPDWEKLVAFLQQCRWKKRYVNEVCDGTQWELKWQTSTQKLSCYGSNHYPLDFNVFLDLLNSCMQGCGLKIEE